MSVPTVYEVTYNGITVRVSRREYERALSYGERQKRLTADTAEYAGWLINYRKRHPYKPRIPSPPQPEDTTS